MSSSLASPQVLKDKPLWIFPLIDKIIYQFETLSDFFVVNGKFQLSLPRWLLLAVLFAYGALEVWELVILKLFNDVNRLLWVGSRLFSFLLINQLDPWDHLSLQIQILNTILKKNGIVECGFYSLKSSAFQLIAVLSQSLVTLSAILSCALYRNSSGTVCSVRGETRSRACCRESWGLHGVVMVLKNGLGLSKPRVTYFSYTFLFHKCECEEGYECRWWD